MQAQLMEVISAETATAATLLKVLEEENHWLPRSEAGAASPFLACRAELLQQLNQLGRQRITLIATAPMDAAANQAMARLADLILRIQEMNQRNQHMVLLHLRGLEGALAQQQPQQPTYGTPGRRPGQSFGAG